MPRPALSEKELFGIRHRLCVAAHELYSNEGYEAVSFRRLAARLETSYTQAYRVFDNKDELFAAVRLGCYQRFKQAIVDADPAGQGPVARLYTLAEVILRYVEHNPADYELMFSSNQPPLGRYPELLEIRQETFDYLAEIASLAADEGMIKDDPRTVLHMAWVALHGLLTLHTAGQLVHGHSLECLVQPMLRTIIGPLLGQETRS